MTEKQIGWRYQRDIDQHHLSMFEELADRLGAALDVGEGPEFNKGEAHWRINLFFDQSLERQDLVAALSLAEKVVGFTDHPVLLQPVYEEDWQAKVRASFPPIQEGQFFIYSFEVEVPEKLIGLHIPAGMAFGTGEHATTGLCLKAYAKLAAKRTFENGLDMGAGSGILAIAAGRLQKTPFLAVDVDEPSVDVCRENVLNNQAEAYVTCVHGDGFAAPGVATRAPYDLVFANILMNPLIAMAVDLAHVLQPGGIAILSGFTGEQAAAVEAAYHQRGLKTLELLERGDWRALVMQRA